MKKLLLLAIISFAFWTSCQQDELSHHPVPTNGIVITSTEYDPQARELFTSIGLMSTSGRVQSVTPVSEIYKFFDTDKDMLNYSMLLPDTSTAYFENLVISKIGNDFYAFVLRYIPDGNYISGTAFEGTIQRYNLDGELIGELSVPSGEPGPSSRSPQAKTNYMSPCVTGYEVECTITYEISTATGLPLPETMTKKCVNKATYGWCGDNAGPIPNPNDGWGTYVPPSTGGSSSNPGTGTNPYDPDAGTGIYPLPNNNSPVVIVDDNAYDTRISGFRSSLSTAEFKFLKLNPDIANHIYSYLEGQIDDSQPNTTAYSPDAVSFAKWTINYFKNHPGATWEQFENWFMTPREAKDLLDYDADFWENPDLTFPQQDLPTWTNFDDNYPRMNGDELVPIIGGDVEAAYDQYPELSRGYCALKLSRALNYSGVTIPQITTTAGNPGTIAGADGKYYFLNAKALNKWMRETFGTNPATTTTPLNANHHHFTAADGGTNGENFPTLVDGYKGIYSMVSTNAQWASGHADLIDDGTCVFGCHFSDDPPAPIDYIDIWVLTD